MRRCAARRPPAKPAMSIAGLSASASISGTLTAAACISYPWLRDPQFATDTLNAVSVAAIRVGNCDVPPLKLSPQSLRSHS